MNDWRLQGQELYLRGAALVFKRYKSTPGSDHEHCDFCWAKFFEPDGYLHEGYSTPDNKHWVCPQCYEDFREMFGWTLIDGNYDTPK